MLKFLALTAFFIMSTIPVLAVGQEAATPKLESLLKSALAETAKGKCPASLMTPLLKGTCEQLMPGFGQMLTQRGDIKTLDFLGIQQSQMGPAEVFRVNFKGGGAMMWMINTAADGKIQVFWTPG
jgi:hypothetical protein